MKLISDKIFKLPKIEISRIFSSHKYIILTYKRTCLILTKDLEIHQKYVDENINEVFISAVLYHKYILLTGNNGILKIIDACKGKYLYSLSGHGGKITDIKIYKDYIFTCSEDCSIRMWNKGICVAIFGGFVGHEDYILSIDISLCGKYLVSSSTDYTIKMWKIPYNQNNEPYKNGMENPQKIIYPIFNTNKVHKSYITKVAFFGKMIISQSINKITIIKPYFDTEIYKPNINSDLIFINDFYIDETSTKFIVYKNHLIYNKDKEIIDVNLRKFSIKKIPVKLNLKQMDMIDDRRIAILYRDGTVETFTIIK
ncbi:WD repeat protein [Spraguea lophii 42_110]|uniref:WD repeat protein n=1 Tax=Spraguea lophii (strain 42_110) TaxID=1358809 RepID=S7W7I9_SPRLO|nr:WD repeat protein [Spraguea lophii 42_110]